MLYKLQQNNLWYLIPGLREGQFVLCHKERGDVGTINNLSSKDIEDLGFVYEGHDDIEACAIKICMFLSSNKKYDYTDIARIIRNFYNSN